MFVEGLCIPVLSFEISIYVKAGGKNRLLLKCPLPIPNNQKVLEKEPQEKEKQ